MMSEELKKLVFGRCNYTLSLEQSMMLVDEAYEAGKQSVVDEMKSRIVKAYTATCVVGYSSGHNDALGEMIEWCEDGN